MIIRIILLYTVIVIGYDVHGDDDTIRSTEKKIKQCDMMNKNIVILELTTLPDYGSIVKQNELSESYHSADTYNTQFCHKSFNNSYYACNNVSKSYVVQFPEE